MGGGPGCAGLPCPRIPFPSITSPQHTLACQFQHSYYLYYLYYQITNTYPGNALAFGSVATTWLASPNSLPLLVPPRKRARTRVPVRTLRVVDLAEAHLDMEKEDQL